MNPPHALDKPVAIAHMEAVRTEAVASGAGMFGTKGVELPESFDATVGLPPRIAADLREVFRISPGMMCGGIYIYDPFRMSAEDTTFTGRLDGGPARWQDFAVVELRQLPVFIERSDGTIWRPAADSFRDMDDSSMLQIAPDVLTFAAWIAMGPGYVDFMDGGDEWSDFLDEHGFLEWENPE